MRAAAREVIDRLHLFARELEQHPTFAPLARPVRQAADVEAEAARAMLDQARLDEDQPGERLDDLKRADERLAATSARLDEVRRQFDGLAKQEDDRRRLAALAERQDGPGRTGGPGRSGRRAGPRPRPARHAPGPSSISLPRAGRPDQPEPGPARRGPGRPRRAGGPARRAGPRLADRQQAQARRTADPSWLAGRLWELAEVQRGVEDDARRLALDVDAPLAENERGRLNADALAAAVEPLERGDLETARQRLEQAENELRRLARDIASVPDDPRAFARRLARRQERLRDLANEAVGQTVADRNKPTDDERAALSKRLEPIRQEQQALGVLLDALPVPDNKRGDRDNARRGQEQARKALDAAEPEGPRPRPGPRRATP